VLAQSDDFVTVWDLSLTGKDTDSLSFFTGYGGRIDYRWESLSSSQFGSWQSTDKGRTVIKSLPKGEKIKLRIGAENLKEFSVYRSQSASNLISVEQWGRAEWETMGNAFAGAKNLDIPAMDIPNLNKVTKMFSMFEDCGSLRNVTSINQWNTSSVIYMNQMFSGASSFNQTINMWNTRNVINMNSMFWGASSFNQSIRDWDTKNVLDMTFMFGYANSFNQPLDKWNTSNVESMIGMFQSAQVFNQSLNSWNTSKVNKMEAMFLEAFLFNGNISDWDVSNVESMGYMFAAAKKFNQPIGKWDVSKTKIMFDMFLNATSFNQPLGRWNVSNATDMTDLFDGAAAFNQPLSEWNTKNVKSMSSMFLNAKSFNQDIGSWNLSKIIPTNGLSNFLDNSGLDCINYSASIKGWSSNVNTPANIKVGCKGLKYGTDAESARKALVTKGWIFVEDQPQGSSCELLGTAVSTQGKISEIVVSPNPATRDFKITGLKDGSEIVIFNIDGREVLKTNYSMENSIEIERLPRGVYILKMGSENSYGYTKLVLE